MKFLEKIRATKDKHDEKNELERKKESVEELLETVPASSEPAVKRLVDFALHVSRHNEYDHDLVILPSKQYRAAAGATAGVAVEDIETCRVVAQHSNGDMVYIAHSYKVDTITLVDLDDWPEPEDLSR